MNCEYSQRHASACEWRLIYTLMAHSYEEEQPSMERHIQYNKRGELKMVGEKTLFDLSEPIWHADEKVCFVLHIVVRVREPLYVGVYVMRRPSLGRKCVF